MIPAARRAMEAAALIAQGRWFSLASGRQTGKTTVVRHLMRAINAQGTHRVLWVDIEEARGVSEPEVAFRTVMNLIDDAAARAMPEFAPWPSETMDAWRSDPPTAIRRCVTDQT